MKFARVTQCEIHSSSRLYSATRSMPIFASFAHLYCFSVRPYLQPSLRVCRAMLKFRAEVEFYSTSCANIRKILNNFFVRNHANKNAAGTAKFISKNIRELSSRLNLAEFIVFWNICASVEKIARCENDQANRRYIRAV